MKPEPKAAKIPERASIGPVPKTKTCPSCHRLRSVRQFEGDHKLCNRCRGK